MAGVAVVAFAAFLQGTPARAAAAAAAIGLAPAVVGLLLAPRWGESWARTACVDAWAIAAGLAVALTGGAASPCAVAFAIGPALAQREGGPRLGLEAAGVAVLGFAGAAILSRVSGVVFEAPSSGAFTVLALAFVGWLLASAPPVAPAVRTEPPPPPPEPTARVDVVQGFANAAHELRTPLNHIQGFADLMQREIFGPLPERYREYVGLIVDGARRLQVLATRWLDLARLDSGQFEIDPKVFDLAALLRDSAAQAEGSAAARAQTLTLEGAETRFDIEADELAVREIVDNLIGNAVKFAPVGGRIGVRLIPGTHALIIDVEDNGAGVSDADKARLGHAFVRGAGAEAFEGAGLGLTLVKALLAAHRGRLEILDAERGGTVMRIVMPVAQP